MKWEDVKINGEELINKINELKNKIDENELKIKEFELTVKIGIEMEVDENGKKVYSNEQKRELEYINRIKNNEDYKKLKNERNSLWVELKKTELYYNYITGKLIKGEVE